MTFSSLTNSKLKIFATLSECFRDFLFRVSLIKSDLDLKHHNKTTSRRLKKIMLSCSRLSSLAAQKTSIILLTHYPATKAHKNFKSKVFRRLKKKIASSRKSCKTLLEEEKNCWKRFKVSWATLLNTWLKPGCQMNEQQNNRGNKIKYFFKIFWNQSLSQMFAGIDWQELHRSGRLTLWDHQ